MLEHRLRLASYPTSPRSDPYGSLLSSFGISHEVLKRSATRDIFQANFDTAQGRRLILIGNHWPARLGVAEYRIVAGETLSYWLERIISGGWYISSTSCGR